MISQKIFTGKMNSDVSEYMLPAGDYLYAMNLRIGSSDGQDIGTVVNTKSNRVISIPDSLQYLFDTASGTVKIKTIGAGVAEDVRKVFWFIYRSDRKDFILEYDSPSETISKILVNLDDTNNVDITKFSLRYPIFSVDLIDGRYLKWTDFNNAPGSIDIINFKLGSYGILDNFHIRAAKAPSLVPPTTEYISDATVVSNRLKKQLFQFQYLYVYDGNERSVYSPMSIRQVPTLEPDPAKDTDSTKYNAIKVGFDVGTNQVKSIELIARYGLNDWFLVQIFDRATITSSDQFGSPKDANYDPSTGVYTFTFYNDGNYNNVDLNEQLLYFDRMPDKARTQEYAQGSMLYAGLIEGKDPVSVSGIVYPSYNEGTYASGSSVYNWKTNSKYKFGMIYYDGFGKATTVNTIPAFTVTTSPFGDAHGDTRVVMNWQITHQPPKWAVKYQWARTENLTHQKWLFWRVNSVTSVTQNTKQYYDIFIDNLESYYRANIGTASSSLVKTTPVIGYSYAVGDRITVHRPSAAGDWIDDYDTEVIDFQVFTPPVLPATQSNDPLYRLRIAAKPGVSLSSGALIEIYTPKPPSPATGEDLNVFYEFGQVFDITNPGTDSATHSVTQGQFNDGDSFYRERKIPTEGPSTDLTHIYTTATEEIEDPGFSDFYISNYNSNGRPNLVDKNNKQNDFPTRIRFSEVYNSDTNINGLSRLYELSYEDYDKAFGPIQRIELRDNYLVSFQRLKTGAIPLFASVTETQTGQVQLILSEKLLNRVRYYFGDFGIGDQPTSFAKSDGLFYYVDPNRGVVLRLDGSGINAISKQAFMDNYFSSILQTYARGNQPINGGFEKRFGEYILSFDNDDMDIFDYNIPLDSEWNNAQPLATLDVSSISIVSQAAHGTASMISPGVLRYVPVAGQDGLMTIVYTADDIFGNPLPNKNLCINVEAPGSGVKWVGINPKCFTISSVTKKYYLNRQLYLSDGSAPYSCDGLDITQQNYNPSDPTGSMADPDYVPEVTDNCFCLNDCTEADGTLNFINVSPYTFIVDESTSTPLALPAHSTHKTNNKNSFHTIKCTNCGPSIIHLYIYDCATVDPLTITPKYNMPNGITFYMSSSDGNTVFLTAGSDPVTTC